MLSFPSATRLKQDELFGLFKEIQRLILEGVKEPPECMMAFVEAVENMDKTLEKAPLNTTTQDIADADAAADAAWLGMNAQLKVSLVHPEAGVREAAERVWNVFGTIDNPTRLSYEAEYGILERLINQLGALDIADREASLIEPWLAELRRTVDVFRAKYTLRNQETERRIGLAKTARIAATDACRSMFEHINASLLLNKNDELAKLSNAIGNVCDNTRIKLKARQTRRLNTAADARDE